METAEPAGLAFSLLPLNVGGPACLARLGQGRELGPAQRFR